MDSNKALIKSAKRHCKITWSDDDTEQDIVDIVEDAIPFLQHKLGIPADKVPDVFESAGDERRLFKEYCLYCWNNMKSEFEKNYKSDILTIRHKYEVEAAKNETETTGSV